MSKRYPKVDSVNLVTADKEYSYTFPVGTKAFILQTRESNAYKYAYVAGDIALNNYITASRGISKMENQTGSEVDIVVYFSCAEVGETMEVEFWR